MKASLFEDFGFTTKAKMTDRVKPASFRNVGIAKKKRVVHGLPLTTL